MQENNNSPENNKTTFYDHCTERVHRALHHANCLVDSNRNEAVEPAHFMLGVLMTEKGGGLHTLNALQLDVEAMQKNLLDAISKYPQVESKEAILPSQKGDTFLATVREEALSLKHNHMGTEHFVLAMFRLREEFPDDLIPTSITYDDARQAVMDWLGIDH